MLVHVFEHADVIDQPPPGWSEEVFTPWREALEDGALALDMLREEQQPIGSAQAWRARWIAEFCRSRPATTDRPDTEIGAAAAATRAARPSILATVSEWAVDEVATALSITTATAQTWMVQSLQLVDRLPATLDALAAGNLTWDHATALCQVIAGLDDDLRAQAEQRLLARLGHKTPTQLRAAAHRLAQRLDASAISRRVQTALRERGITVYPTGDGLGSLSVTNLPLPVLRAVQDALRQYADAAHTPGDPRTRQQRMVDTLIDLVLRPGAHGLAPVQAQLTIIATIATLLGGDDPGEISGDIVPAAHCPRPRPSARPAARRRTAARPDRPRARGAVRRPTEREAHPPALLPPSPAAADPLPATPSPRASPTCSPPARCAAPRWPPDRTSPWSTSSPASCSPSPTPPASAPAEHSARRHPPTPTGPPTRSTATSRPATDAAASPAAAAPPTAATPTTSPAGPTATPPPTTSAACAATTTGSSTKHPAGNCTPYPTAHSASPPPPARSSSPDPPDPTTTTDHHPEPTTGRHPTRIHPATTRHRSKAPAPPAGVPTGLWPRSTSVEMFWLLSTG